jgi:hypothetical protein
MTISKESLTLLLPLHKVLHSSANMGKTLPATEREERPREGTGRIASYLCFLTGSVWPNYCMHQHVKFLFYLRGPGFLAVVCLAPPPPIPPSPVIKLSLFLSFPLCRRSSLLRGKGGWVCGWGGREAKSYDSEKALSSINHLNSLVPYM